MSQEDVRKHAREWLVTGPYIMIGPLALWCTCHGRIGLVFFWDGSRLHVGELQQPLVTAYCVVLLF